jgi:hypothetical protein
MMVEWRSARVLRAEHAREQARAKWEGRSLPRQEVPDAQIILRMPGGGLVTVDIEIDGQYYGMMLRDKAAAYGRSRRPVLWVCTAPREPLVRTAIQPYSNIDLLVVR